MSVLIIVVLSLAFHLHCAISAVLTTVINVYFPTNHHNTLPAAQNGELSFVGQGGGITTYIFSQPGNPPMFATLIEGDDVAILVAGNPTVLASYSCDFQVNQALCHVQAINPANNQIVKQFVTTDAPLDSLALVEVGLPAPNPPATKPPPAAPGGNGGSAPSPSSNAPSPSSNGNNSPASPSNGNAAPGSSPTGNSTPSSTGNGTPASTPSGNQGQSSSSSAAQGLPSNGLPIPGSPVSGSQPADQGIIPVPSVISKASHNSVALGASILLAVLSTYDTWLA